MLPNNIASSIKFIMYANMFAKATSSARLGNFTKLVTTPKSAKFLGMHKQKCLLSLVI